MPPIIDAFNPLSWQALCYDPHHRIVLRGRDGTEHIIAVCFNCSKIGFDQGFATNFPVFWEGRLRALFTRYGMTERSEGKYSALRRTIPPE